MSEEGYVDEEKGFRTLRPCDKWTPLDGSVSAPLDGSVSAGQAVGNRSTVWSILRVSDSFLPQLLPVFIQRAFKDGGRHEFSLTIPSQLTVSLPAVEARAMLSP